MKENSIEEKIKIIKEKMNKELDFLIENANKTEQLTAISIIAMKEPIILLFLSILQDYKRVLKENEELLEVKVSASAHNRILELEKENEELKNNGVIDENEFEFAVDCDWDRLKRLIDTADKSEEFILYNNEKWIKEKYCIPVSLVKGKIEELENAYWYCENVKNQTIEALEELLEESEKR